MNELEINIGDENLKFNNFDSYGNKLKKRITFINIPTKLHENDDKEQFSLDNKSQQNSIKILNLISENKDVFKFHLSYEEEKKEKIEYDKMDIELINSFYDNYSKALSNLDYEQSDIESNKENKYHNLFYGGEEIQNFNNYIKKGFEKYKFNNSESDYNFVKKLCFALIYYKKKNLNFKSTLYNYTGNMFDKYNCFSELDFIDRIKCLITLTNEYITEEENDSDNDCSIVCIENKNYNKYDYVRKAHKILLGIINDLTEKSSLFHIIHQFNSEISKEINTNASLYSGSVLNINDIKLEIFKHLNPFYLLSFHKGKIYGAIYNNTKVTVLYPRCFSSDIEIKGEDKKEIQERKSAAVLIILFHELCGHLKTHINNIPDSPKTIYLQNLKIEEVQLYKNDSGFLLEHVFANGSIEVKNFINSEYSKNLLKKSIYLGDNFSELNEILSNIKGSVVKNPESKPDFFKDLFGKGINEEDSNRIFREKYKELDYYELTKLLSSMSEKELEKNKDICDYYNETFFSDPNKKY